MTPKQKIYVHKVTGEEIGYFAGHIPFIDGRVQAHAVKSYEERTNPKAKTRFTWEENAPFHKAVTFTGFERGRSAAHAIFRDTLDDTKRPWRVQMFLTDLEDLIRGEVNISHFKGIMTYTKRGQNYGFKLLELAKPETD